MACVDGFRHGAYRLTYSNKRDDAISDSVAVVIGHSVRNQMTPEVYINLKVSGNLGASAVPHTALPDPAAAKDVRGCALFEEIPGYLRPITTNLFAV